VRYAAISFPEDGLNWDIIGQVGRLLKTRTALNPVNGYGVRHIIAQGWSGGGALLLIFISDGFHDRARMPGGGPVIDGYLVGEPSGYPKINSAAPALANEDARQKVRAIDVPVISLHTHPQEPYRRRPDGNGTHDRYRVYEVAGASHNNRRLPLIYRQADAIFSQTGCIAEVSRFPMHHFFKSALSRLDHWVLGNIAPPPSLRMDLKPDGTPMLDANGNPLGGVPSSYVDVPTARYYANAPAAGAPAIPAATGFCALDGAQERFPPEKLRTLYGTRANYAASAIRRVNQLQRAGWLLPVDAQELRKEALRFRGF
jgi:alpha/beta hydrolase family protein